MTMTSLTNVVRRIAKSYARDRRAGLGVVDERVPGLPARDEEPPAVVVDTDGDSSRLRRARRWLLHRCAGFLRTRRRWRASRHRTSRPARWRSPRAASRSAARSCPGTPSALDPAAAVASNAADSDDQGDASHRALLPVVGNGVLDAIPASALSIPASRRFGLDAMLARLGTCSTRRASSGRGRRGGCAEDVLAWLTTVSPARHAAARPGLVPLGRRREHPRLQQAGHSRSCGTSRRNPRVSLHLDGNGQGGDIVVCLGQARSRTIRRPHEIPEYVDEVRRSSSATAGRRSRSPPTTRCRCASRSRASAATRRVWRNGARRRGALEVVMQGRREPAYWTSTWATEDAAARPPA